jgi:hypothetical protein
VRAKDVVSTLVQVSAPLGHVDLALQVFEGMMVRASAALSS